MLVGSRLVEWDAGGLSFDGGAAAEVLWEGVARSGVRHLAVADNWLLSHTLRQVDGLGEVTRLNVAGGDLDDAGLDAIARKPWASRLEVLDLRMNLVSAEAVDEVRARLPGCDVIWYPHGPVV